jgi:predicted glycogen debranching enzyme
VFSDNVWRGLIPNRFTEAGGSEYNTVDAPLWFIHACYKYLEYTEDVDFVKTSLWSTIQSIISYYRGGTDGVYADSDGLIVSAAQMTWMDAKLGDWIVTPRAGKACEINALWYNALKIAGGMANLFDEEDSVYRELGEAVKKSYEKFWNPEQQCLFDLIDPLDDSIRPNQIFAVALPYPVVSKKQAEKIIEVVESVLLTPFGLRTLSPSHPDYKPRYGGDASSRDAAYHQGTVWPWLLGAFVTAYLNVHGRSEKNLWYMRELLRPLEEHLSFAGLGSISEVFDAAPPHAPGGCIMQAWSVAELLRCLSEDLKIR